MIVATWQKYSRKHRLVFSLLPTTHFASLMHVCSLFCSPTSDSNLHALPRPRHVSQTRPVLLTTPRTHRQHHQPCCLLACFPVPPHFNHTLHPLGTHTPFRTTSFNYLTSTRLDTSPPRPSTPRNISCRHTRFFHNSTSTTSTATPQTLAHTTRTS